MKTLIIHPDDRSTDFLRDIYRDLKNVTVLTEDVSRKELHRQIEQHDQVVMLGHGSPSGLFNVARIGDGAFTISRNEVPLLREKRCVFIWCHADQFVREHRLEGLSSGMFISEVSEARWYKVPADQEAVDTSNEYFARTLGEALVASEDYRQVLEHVSRGYRQLAEINTVAAYNAKRWYLWD